jgi:hypothetical protein
MPGVYVAHDETYASATGVVCIAEHRVIIFRSSGAANGLGFGHND